MKALVVGNFGHSWDGSICDEEHIASALESRGVTVERIQREELSGAKPEPCDFAVIAQWNGYPENMVAELKKHVKGPIIYWAFDYQWMSKEDWHLRLVKESDIFLTKEIEHIPAYQEMAPDTVIRWLPQDFAPQFITRKAGGKLDIDVLFMGSYLPWATERTDLLKAVDKEFDLHVYTVTVDEWKAQGLKNVFPGIMDEPMAGLVGRARLNLSIDHVHSAGYWSDRNAQIMAAGGLVLFRHVPYSEIVFRDCVVYFHTIDECLEKIRFYLRNEAECRPVRSRAFLYAKSHLTVRDRVKDLLTIVGEFV